MQYFPPQIPFDQSPNYDSGTANKIGYVFHATLGRFIGAKETLKARVRRDANGNDLGRASCHLLISERDKEWCELVHVKDIAWHAGKVSNPDAIGQKALLKNASKNYINPNQYMIGIEFCCGWDVNRNGHIDVSELDLTEWQYEAAAQYIARNHLLFGVPISKDHCIGHTNMTDYKKDNMIRHVDRVLARARDIAAPYTPRTPQPTPGVAPVAPKQPEVCIPAKEVESIKESVKNKEVLGLFQKIKRLFS